MTSGELEINAGLRIPLRELQIEFVRASGPGGQNVNKVATAAQLRFDIFRSSLPDEVKARLAKLGGRRVTTEGVLIIEARRFRTQEQNRDDALQRLIGLVQRAARRPSTRKPTRPTKSSKESRLRAKKRRGEIKSLRRVRHADD